MWNYFSSNEPASRVELCKIESSTDWICMMLSEMHGAGTRLSTSHLSEAVRPSAAEAETELERLPVACATFTRRGHIEFASSCFTPTPTFFSNSTVNLLSATMHWRKLIISAKVNVVNWRRLNNRVVCLPVCVCVHVSDSVCAIAIVTSPTASLHCHYTTSRLVVAVLVVVVVIVVEMLKLLHLAKICTLTSAF